MDFLLWYWFRNNTMQSAYTNASSQGNICSQLIIIAQFLTSVSLITRSGQSLVMLNRLFVYNGCSINQPTFWFVVKHIKHGHIFYRWETLDWDSTSEKIQPTPGTGFYKRHTECTAKVSKMVPWKWSQWSWNSTNMEERVSCYPSPHPQPQKIKIKISECLIFTYTRLLYCVMLPYLRFTFTLLNILNHFRRMTRSRR